MKKKILSLLLAFSMLAAFVPAVYAETQDANGNYTGMCESYWDSTSQSEISSKAQWTYNPSTDTVTISGTGYASITDMCDIFNVVPMGSVNNNHNMQPVYNFVVEEGITGITIMNFGDLRAITLPDSLTEIGGYSFDRCDISNIIIPDNVTKIYEFAFSDCKSLTNVTIPKSMKTINANAFADSPVKDVIYKGTKAQWQQFPLSNIYSFPKELANANVHCSDGQADPPPAPPHGMYTVSGNSTIFHVPVDVSAMPSSFSMFSVWIWVSDAAGVIKGSNYCWYDIDGCSGTVDLRVPGKLNVGDRVHFTIWPIW